MNGSTAKKLRRVAFGKTARHGKRRYLINDKGVIIVDGVRHVYQHIKTAYKMMRSAGMKQRMIREVIYGK